MTSSLNSRLIYTTAHTTSHVGSDSHLFPFLPPSLLQTAVPWLSKLHNPILLMPKNSYVIFFTLNIQACQLLPSKHIPLDLFSQSLPPPPYNSPPCPPSSAVYSLSLKELSHSGAMTPRFHLISTYPSEDPHFPSRHSRISGPEISSPHHSAWLRVHQACLTWTKRCSLQLRHPPTVNPHCKAAMALAPADGLSTFPHV